jgi:hypothetical protein
MNLDGRFFLVLVHHLLNRLHNLFGCQRHWICGRLGLVYEHSDSEHPRLLVSCLLIFLDGKTFLPYLSRLNL